MENDLTDEQMQKEINRSHAVTSVAETIIHNGELSLKAMKHVEEYGCGSDGGKKLPPMLDMQ